MTQDTGHRPEHIVRLSLPDTPDAAPRPSWPATAAIVGGVLLVLLAAAIALRRRAADYDPAAAAHTKISRRLGLSRRERRSLEGLAAAVEIKPVALLLSPDALERACNAAPPEIVAAAEPALRKILAPDPRLSRKADAKA